MSSRFSSRRTRSSQRRPAAESTQPAHPPWYLAAIWKIGRKLTPGTPSQPSSPFEGSIADDLRHNRLGNAIVRFYRLKAKLTNSGRGKPGATVIIVNYNTMHYLETSISAIRRFSAPDTEILVVDNKSNDGSREWLRSKPGGAYSVRLPMNVDHGRGLDIGLLMCRTEHAILLDSDAFPLRHGWIERLTQPLLDGEVDAVGAHGGRDRLHPLCMAVSRRFYVELGVSFGGREDPVPGGDVIWGENRWDVGEYFSQHVDVARRKLLETKRTELGEFVEDIVFHLRLGTTGNRGSKRDNAVRDVAEETRSRWNRAVAEALSDLHVETTTRQ